MTGGSGSYKLTLEELGIKSLHHFATTQTIRLYKKGIKSSTYLSMIVNDKPTGRAQMWCWRNRVVRIMKKLSINEADSILQVKHKCSAHFKQKELRDKNMTLSFSRYMSRDFKASREYMSKVTDFKSRDALFQFRAQQIWHPVQANRAKLTKSSNCPCCQDNVSNINAHLLVECPSLHDERIQILSASIFPVLNLIGRETLDFDFCCDSNNVTTLLLGGSVDYNGKVIKLNAKQWINKGFAAVVAQFCALSLKKYNMALFDPTNRCDEMDQENALGQEEHEATLLIQEVISFQTSLSPSTDTAVLHAPGHRIE